MVKALIPFVDLRGKTPMDLLRAYEDKARELIKASRRTYGFLSAAAASAALPFADWRSHAWLKKTRNPYLHEIESFADIAGIPGLYALNLSYEWACTSGAYRTGESVTMLRVLDWPFPALGKHAMVVLQKGKAGEFYNITWPGVSGVYTAMAPGKFSAAINQAPMRMHKLGFAGDWIANRLITNKAVGLPPSHLLRQVCEYADSYDMARRMLITAPLALPAIFILAGVKPGEGCIIERLEHAAEITDLSAGLQVSASNHFNSALATSDDGWRPRAIDSEGRCRQSRSVYGYELAKPDFAWLKSPIVNPLTRLCVITNAATCQLMVQGFEGTAPATAVFNLPETAAEKNQAMTAYQ